MPGFSTSPLEAQVTNIERAGFWLLTSDGEFFVSFDEYPEFRAATVAQIHNFRSTSGHINWPDLDVDIEVTFSVL
jgi:hypothetical protein